MRATDAGTRVRRLRARCVNGKLQPVSMWTRRRRALWIVAFAIYAAVAIEVGVRRGSDFEAELGQSERLLHGSPLFAAVSSRIGLPWPPFSALALTPFAVVARLDLQLSKALWAVLSLACLLWSVCRVPSERRWAVGWALAAVAVPLHRNFEDLNINCVLLALTLAAVAALDRRREQRAAGWIGVATALKAFPGLLLGYFASRRRWRTVALGAALARALVNIDSAVHLCGVGGRAMAAAGIASPFAIDELAIIGLTAIPRRRAPVAWHRHCRVSLRRQDRQGGNGSWQSRCSPTSSPPRSSR